MTSLKSCEGCGASSWMGNTCEYCLRKKDSLPEISVHSREFVITEAQNVRMFNNQQAAMAQNLACQQYVNSQMQNNTQSPWWGSLGNPFYGR